MDKVENLECLYQGYGILEEKWVTDSQWTHYFRGKLVCMQNMIQIHQFFHKILGGHHLHISEDDLIISEISKLLAKNCRRSFKMIGQKV